MMASLKAILSRCRDFQTISRIATHANSDADYANASHVK